MYRSNDVRLTLDGVSTIGAIHGGTAGADVPPQEVSFTLYRADVRVRIGKSGDYAIPIWFIQSPAEGRTYVNMSAHLSPPETLKTAYLPIPDGRFARITLEKNSLGNSITVADVPLARLPLPAEKPEDVQREVGEHLLRAKAVLGVKNPSLLLGPIRLQKVETTLGINEEAGSFYLLRAISADMRLGRRTYPIRIWATRENVNVDTIAYDLTRPSLPGRIPPNPPTLERTKGGDASMVVDSPAIGLWKVAQSLPITKIQIAARTSVDLWDAVYYFCHSDPEFNRKYCGVWTSEPAYIGLPWDAEFKPWRDTIARWTAQQLRSSCTSYMNDGAVPIPAGTELILIATDGNPLPRGKKVQFTSSEDMGTPIRFRGQAELTVIPADAFRDLGLSVKSVALIRMGTCEQLALTAVDYGVTQFPVSIPKSVIKGRAKPTNR